MEFHNKKILFGAKEAGAGSLLAELAAIWEPKFGSLALVTEISCDYFKKKSIKTRIIEETITIEETINIIQEIDPDIVVVGASVGASIEKKLILASLRINKPIASFVDHYWNLWQRFANEETAEKWFYNPDYIFVPTLNCYERIILQGAPSAKLFVFEHPLINKYIIDSPQFDADVAREKLDLLQTDTIVLFISEYNFANSDKWEWEQSPDKDIKELLNALLFSANQISDKNRNVIIIIKMHPTQTENFSDILYGYSENSYRIVYSFDKVSLFQVCDVAFGLNSMLLLEAVRFGIPSYSYYGHDTDNRIHLTTIHNKIKEISNLNSCKGIISDLV